MRIKSEKKRQAILDVAAQLFLEFGFERTSMSEICSRVGGSKATLYNHFASKEELFFEVMFSSIEMEFGATQACLDPKTKNVSETLLAFGIRLLTLAYSPKVLAGRRLMVAEAGRSNLGPLCYARGHLRNETAMTEFMHAAMAHGQIRDTDARVAAQHLLGLLESELIERHMLCVDEPVSEEKIRGATRRAVDVFMMAYGRQ